MEKSESDKIKLGLFVITGVSLFILVIYFIGNKQQLFGNTQHITAVFNNVNGLQLGDNVRYSGINIGTVRGIDMVNDTTIQVDLLIDQSMLVHIKKNAKASIGSDGLVGSKVINISPGKGSFPSIQKGDTLYSTAFIKTDDMMSTLEITNKNAALLTADLLLITKKINQGKGTLGLLLQDTTMGTHLKQTLLNLKTTSDDTREMMSNLKKTTQSLNNKKNIMGVINDPINAQKLSTTIANIEQSSQEISKVVSNLNQTIENVKNGKGVLNYLTNDPHLVKKIDSTLSNINKASILLNQDLEAMQHSFLLRGYFKKQNKKTK